MILGCIADDFTGASDAASFLEQGGMRTLLLSGVPETEEQGLVDAADAVVIALKTRTQETSSAVADSIGAIRWLRERGAERFYVKYCSTFDSTPQGNIGPICDAVMDELRVPFTLLCPSLPINGRTVRDGILYVNGVPLAESPMKDHPLTPMRESSLAKLMAPQSRYDCRVLSRREMQTETAFAEDNPRYLIPDFETEHDAEAIVRRFGDARLLTGGSGLLTAWARHLMKKTGAERTQMSGTDGAGLLLAGSCSRATLAQIAHFQSGGGSSLKIDPERILAGEQTLSDIRTFLSAHATEDVLIYSSETPGYLETIRETTLSEYSAALETMMADTAIMSYTMGRRRIIVAGGETSGAVTRALGDATYWIGPSIAPGVPMLMPTTRKDMRLVLKSGNFGQEDFFERALRMTTKEKEHG